MRRRNCGIRVTYARTSAGTWLPSTIVKLFYVQPNFPPGKCVPYKVRAFSEPTNDKANAAGVAAAE